MTLLEAMERRHSVRSYTDQPICGEVLASLEREVRACNTEGGLHIQLVTGEPEAFRGVLAHYGKFRNVKNYLALVGPGGPSLEERAGYYGERLVLTAAMLGLDSCWVALTFRKGKCQYVARPGEKLVCVIALGYGEGHGVPHKSKPLEALCRTEGPMPDWFRRGMEAALLAPTATNQQKFRFTLSGDAVRAESTGGFYSKVDLGIVKYHFEVGAGPAAFHWTSPGR